LFYCNSIFGTVFFIYILFYSRLKLQNIKLPVVFKRDIVGRVRNIEETGDVEGIEKVWEKAGKV
jgi:hypothetical protein